ncbi:MAG: substrate-binding domain-containing protein [Nitrospiraceae bacterium]
MLSIFVIANALVPVSATSAGTLGGMVIAGYGPERPLIEKLAHTFEKANPGSVIDIRWDRNLKAIDMVKAGQAHIAVTGEEDSELTATPIGWDGIAVIVNFSNPVEEISSQQVAALFTGKVKSWSELGGADARVQLIRRPPNRNLNAGFEKTLGIAGQIPDSAKVFRSDQKVLSEVGGNLSAVSYLPLGAALAALQYGMPIRALIIDRAEAAEPTVKDGRYKLRRPVLLLSGKKANPVAEAFIAFALSKEGQKIVDEQFIPYGQPDKNP